MSLKYNHIIPPRASHHIVAASILAWTMICIAIATLYCAIPLSMRGYGARALYGCQNRRSSFFSARRSQES